MYRHKGSKSGVYQRDGGGMVMYSECIGGGVHGKFRGTGFSFRARAGRV